jgi:hypothetical protein
MGVMVVVGIVFVLVEVGVASGVVAILVAVDEGGLPQAARMSITSMIERQLASQPGCIEVFFDIEVRSSKMSWIDSRGGLTFAKFHLQTPSRLLLG